MSVIVVAELRIKDQEAYARYKGDVTSVVESFGGRFWVRGGKSEVVEGDWDPEYVVILEFPDSESPWRFYQSEDYRQLKADRMAFADSNVVAFESLV